MAPVMEGQNTSSRVALSMKGSYIKRDSWIGLSVTPKRSETRHRASSCTYKKSYYTRALCIHIACVGFQYIFVKVTG